MYSSPVTVAAVHRLSTIKGTPTCSSLNNTASYETYVQGQEAPGSVVLSKVHEL